MKFNRIYLVVLMLAGCASTEHEKTADCSAYREAARDLRLGSAAMPLNVDARIAWLSLELDAAKAGCDLKGGRLR